jgi:hypothetical protein
MSEATNASDRISSETMTPGTPQRGDVPERGLLIGGKSVPASSAKLADDVCPWDGEIYAPSPPARRRTSPGRPTPATWSPP